MTNTDQQQTTTNDKQQPMTKNDQRQTTTNNKQRPIQGPGGVPKKEK